MRHLSSILFLKKLVLDLDIPVNRWFCYRQQELGQAPIPVEDSQGAQDQPKVPLRDQSKK